MSFANCIIKIAKTLEGKLPDDVAEKIVRELERRVDEFQRGDIFPELASDFEAALIKAGDEMALEEVRVAKVLKRNALDNIRKKKARRARLLAILGTKGAKLDDAIQAITVGIQKGAKGAKLSVATMQRSLSERWQSGVTTELEAAGLMRAFNSNVLGRQVARELQELSTHAGQVGISGSKDALTMAKILWRHQRQALIRLNRAGADIATLEGFITSQTHNRARMRKLGYDAWVESILPRLDHERTFNGVEPSIFLKEAYTDILSGKLLKVQSADTARVAGFEGVGNVAKKHSRSRKLHFKDSDSWFDYDQEFGAANLGEMILETLKRQAHDVVLLDVYGTNPQAAFDADLEFLRKKFRGDFRALEKIEAGALRQLKVQFKEIDGSMRYSENPQMAQFTANWRAVQNLSKLGGVLLTSFADIPIKASTIRVNGMGYLRGYLNSLEAVVEGRGSTELKHISSLFGVGSDGLRGGGIARHAGDDVEPGFMTRAQRPFFKLTGLTWWNDAQKTATGKMLSHNLALNKGKAFNALDEDLNRMLGLYDIGTKEWDIIRKAGVKLADGKEYVTPELVQDLSDDVIKGFIGNTEASASAISRAKDQIESKLAAYYIDQIEVATLTPGARENAILRQGHQPGTPIGDALKLMTQYKQFPLSIMTKVWGRDLQLKGRIDTVAIIHMSVMHTALGYTVLALKDLAAGKTPRDPELPRTWVDAMTQGGAYGILGDLVFAETNTYGGNIALRALGPTFGGILGEGDKLLKNFVEGKDVSGSALRTALSITPGQNLFYTRGAINHLFLYDIQEQMNPGFKRRLQKRNIERGQRSLFN